MGIDGDSAFAILNGDLATSASVFSKIIGPAESDKIGACKRSLLSLRDMVGKPNLPFRLHHTHPLFYHLGGKIRPLG